MKHEKRVLTDVSKETHRKFKIEAAKKGKKMSELVSGFMESYGKGKANSENERHNEDKKNPNIQDEVREDSLSENPIQDEPKVQTVLKPKEITYVVCPFCKEQINVKGVCGHIRLKHNIPGISLQDLDSVEEESKSLEELVNEKFEDDSKAYMTGVLDEVMEKDFPSWEDVEPEETDQEGVDQEEAAKQKPGQEEIVQEEAAEKEGENSGIASLITIILVAALGYVAYDKQVEISNVLNSFFNKVNKLVPGSKNSSGSKQSYGFGQHAVDLNKSRGS